MKTRLSYLTIILLAYACSKDNSVKQDAVNAALTASDAAITTCDMFKYPDSIFYMKQLSGTDYIVKPLNKLAGTYGAFPFGLRINKLNGNINVTKSETGLRYIVWFVATGSTDTCKKFITISGIDYTDSVYVMASGPTVANPVYNATVSLPPDCSGGCNFDDGKTVTQQGIVIDTATGKINFGKSIKNGALGVNPPNGTFKDFNLNYRIGDKSAKALNKISFRLYYYLNQSQIPAKLLDEVSSKKGQVILENETGDDSGGHGGHGGGNDDKFSGYNLSGSANLTAKNGQGEIKCRPPYIIVTQK